MARDTVLHVQVLLHEWDVCVCMDRGMVLHVQVLMHEWDVCAWPGTPWLDLGCPAAGVSVPVLTCGYMWRSASTSSRTDLCTMSAPCWDLCMCAQGSYTQGNPQWKGSWWLETFPHFRTPELL